MVYADDDRSTPIVGIIMGSQSDWPTMKNAALILDELGIPYEKRIISAHRTPKRMTDYAENARERGLKIIVAGAGGAAHLPGMVAAQTTLPVLGVPVESKALSGMDSLLSIVQMPKGVPVGALAIGMAGAANAVILPNCPPPIIPIMEPGGKTSKELFFIYFRLVHRRQPRFEHLATP